MQRADAPLAAGPFASEGTQVLSWLPAAFKGAKRGPACRDGRTSHILGQACSIPSNRQGLLPAPLKALRGRQETLCVRLQVGAAANGAAAGRLTQCRSAAKTCPAEWLRSDRRQPLGTTGYCSPLVLSMSKRETDQLEAALVKTICPVMVTCQAVPSSVRLTGSVTGARGAVRNAG